MPAGKLHKRPVKRKEVAVARLKRLRDHKMEWNSEVGYFQHHHKVAFDYLRSGVGNPSEVITALKFLSIFNQRTKRLIQLSKLARRSNEREGQPISAEFDRELASTEALHHHVTDLLNVYRRMRKSK